MKLRDGQMLSGDASIADGHFYLVIWCFYLEFRWVGDSGRRKYRKPRGDFDAWDDLNKNTPPTPRYINNR